MEDHTLDTLDIYIVDTKSRDTHVSSRSLDSNILLGILPIEIIVGVLANSWAFAIIIRRRLWLQHEGYVYLAAILITNALILALQYGPNWFWILDDSYDITRKADFLCKAYNFFFNGFHLTGLLVVALLFNVCLRKAVTKREDEEAQPSSHRPSICALIVALTLIILTLLVNIGQLLSFELQEHTSSKEYYCSLARNWFGLVIWNVVAAFVLHGIPIIFILPVLFTLIACSGCTCTGCKFGDNSREHFPRGTLLTLAAIIHFLELPASAWAVFGYSLFNSSHNHVLLTNMYVVSTLVDGFVLAIVPILCIVTMPKLREATCKADCCSCGHRRTLDVEAIALRQAAQDN